MRYNFFTGSPIGVESDGVVCGLSVCLPVCGEVRAARALEGGLRHTRGDASGEGVTSNQ